MKISNEIPGYFSESISLIGYVPTQFTGRVKTSSISFYDSWLISVLLVENSLGSLNLKAYLNNS